MVDPDLRVTLEGIARDESVDMEIRTSAWEVAVWLLRREEEQEGAAV